MTSMHRGRLAAAAVLTATVAAVAFGGSTVSTAWTQSSAGSLHAGTARVDNAFTTGDLVLSNALPGDHGPTATIAYTNHGSTAEHLVFTVDPSGAALGPLAHYLEVNLGALGVARLDQLPATIDLGLLDPGQTLSLPNVSLTLATDTPNSAAGQVVEATYTLTATAAHDPADPNS